MSSLRRLTIVILAVCFLEDVIAVPFMVSSSDRTPGTPPGLAIVAGGIIAALTLAGAAGLIRGSRWAWWLSLIARIADLLNSVMGVGAHPTAALTAGGVFAVVASIVAIVLLVRVRREQRVSRQQEVSPAATRV
jgi:hypothetical protein